MTTESDGLQVFEKALKRCNEKLAAKSVQTEVLDSVRKQLEYLVSVSTDPDADRSRLKDIILAIYAVREFETTDQSFADLLSKADNYARLMRSGPWTP
jgi:hypothetical protein